MINKLSISIILVALSCFSLQAEEGIYYENAKITGKEYIFAGSAAHYAVSASVNETSPESQSADIIYIVDNSKIYNKDNLFTSQKDFHGSQRHNAKTEIKTDLSTNDIATKDEEEPRTLLLPTFPLSQSSSSFLHVGGESTAILLQQRNNGKQPETNSSRQNIYQVITNPYLSLFHPEQRQKLSAAATQCGMLTSFGSNTPPHSAL